MRACRLVAAFGLAACAVDAEGRNANSSAEAAASDGSAGGAAWNGEPSAAEPSDEPRPPEPMPAGPNAPEADWTAPALPSTPTGVQPAPAAERLATPCTSQSWPDDPCAGEPASCPWRIARVIECPGYPGYPSLVMRAGAAHIGLWVSGPEARDEHVLLVSVDEHGDLVEQTRRIGLPGVVALDADGEPALIEYTHRKAPNVVTVHRADGSRSAFSVAGEPWRATFAPDGSLRVLSSAFQSAEASYRVWLHEGRSDGELTRRELPGSMRHPVLFPHELDFVHRDQGVVTLSRILADGRRVDLSTDVSPLLSRLSALEAVDDGTLGTRASLVSWDTDGVVRVLAGEPPEDPSEALSIPRAATPSCSGSVELAECPADAPREPLGVELWDHALARGADGEPWLFALASDTSLHCVFASSCTDASCRCARVPLREAGALRLHARPLESGQEHALDLGALGAQPKLLVAHDEAGRIAVAVVGMADDATEIGSHTTRILYLGL